MSQGGTCLKGVVRTHKGVVCGLTAVDEWPAVLVDNQALGKRVVIGGTKDEYEELLRLMVVAGCVCVKVGKGDWVEEGDTFLAEGLNVPVKLRFEMDDCEMSHVEEAPAVAAGMEPVYVSVGDSLSNPHGKRVGRVTNVGAGDVYLPARKPFMRGGTNKADDLDPILGADKGKVPSKWANDLSEMSLFYKDEEDVIGSMAGASDELPACSRGYEVRVRELADSVKRMKAVLGILLVVNGLASPDKRLAAEKRWGRMAREWDESVARASEQANVDAVV